MIYCIILTNNSRSYTYIDYLVKKKLNPKQVILIDDNKNLRIKKLILQRIDKKINVKIFKSKTINDKNILKYIKSLNQKIFVYSGYPGQLVKDDKLLKKKFFLHSHTGKIPFYKGSTTIFYSLLLEGKIFCTSFKLNKNIDSGQIIYEKQYPLPKNIKNIDNYDNIIRATNTFKSLKLLKKKIKLKAQKNKSKFSDYHIMHPVLRYLACK